MPRQIQEKEQEFVLEHFFGKTPVLRVIEFFLINKEEEFTITQICEGANVGRTIMYESLLKHLLDEGILINSKKIGKSRLFKLNLISEKVMFLFQLRSRLIGEKNANRTIGEYRLFRR